MAQTDTGKLDIGDPIPKLTFQLIDGRTLTIPDDLQGNWGVLLVYRGHW
jgi:peroxiredoxin